MISFFDLDGTILDITERWHSLHIDMARVHELPVLPRSTYIAQKREGIPERDIMIGGGAVPNEALETYLAERIERIEDDAYLALDIPVPGITDVLDAWLASQELVLVTKRARKEALPAELARLGLAPYFSRVLATAGSSKGSVIQDAHPEHEYKDALFVTDSQEDWETARALGMQPLVVSYGCRSERALRAAGIEHLIARPYDLMAYV